MKEHENDKKHEKINISPFWTAPAVMMILVESVNFFCNDEAWKNFLTKTAPVSASFIAYALQYVSAIFFFSPKEFAINKRLKRDEEILIRQLEEANEKPYLYTPEQLAEIREDLADTRRQLRRIGRSSL